MTKALIVLAGCIALLIALMLALGIYRFNAVHTMPPLNTAVKIDPKSATYALDGQVFTLVNGRIEQESAPGSAATTTISLFGEPVAGDLNGDGAEDAAVFLVKNAGGSGTFYYAVLVMNVGGTSRPTNTLILGDRIAPQTVEIQDGRAVFNYAERAAGEPITTPPSVGKSLYVQYDKASGTIGEWVKDFQGESAGGLRESEARAIAEAGCIKGGSALGPGTYNRKAQTWWYDANLNSRKAHCNAACVVDEVPKTAQIVWKCEKGFSPPTK